MSKRGLGGVSIALFLAVVGTGCGAKTSLPVGFDDDTRPQSRPPPGGTIALTDPRGETVDYDLLDPDLECTSLEGDAYRIHYAVNGVVVTIQFLPYDGPGEYTSDNVRVQGDTERLPECVGPCAEVDFHDNYTVVASSSNGDGYATSGTLDCVVASDV